jgi:hypothetical protein
MKNKFILILFLLFSFNVIAETVTCTSTDPDLKIKIVPVFIDPNVGAFEYLQLKVEKKSSEFAQRVHFKTLVKRVRVVGGFEYVGLPDKSEVSLKITSQSLPVENVKTDLLLNRGRVSARKFEGLTCSIQGQPFGHYSECPKEEEVSDLLSRASRVGNLDEIQDLIACGADPSVKDLEGCSSLLNLAYGKCGSPADQWGYIAPSSGTNGRNFLETLDVLLSQGAIADEADPMSLRTAIHYFTLTNHPDALISLLDFEADVNAKDFFGNTPLIYAASKGDGYLVKTLNGYNPDRGIKNLDGKTAYDIAKELNYHHLLPLLEVTSREVVINGNSDGSCSPLMLHLETGPVTFVLKATSRMFMLTIPKLDVELMASAGQEEKVAVNLSAGTFNFSCGVHGGKEYEGSIMAH